ncbi:hypothetical protein [Bifidobacterium samirii]|uniref:Uncharacterized protein n=1 Tax=Bifidobacterium samirii TaxID=2306974 RepID=A0A430FJX5_9BIFI|nr:hypothetical protein [Bifidobacterium samirii]RSX53028.1 hypothetical protein D2E24_1699 [Bifidobacterium samirii]
MNEREYASITPELIADQGDTRPVRIQYGDVRMDLPASTTHAASP